MSVTVTFSDPDELGKLLVAFVNSSNQSLGAQLMSVLTPHLDALEAKITSTTGTVLAQVNDLKTQIDTLTATAAANAIPQAELDRLDALTEKVGFIDPANSAVIPPAPGPVDPSPPSA